MFRIFENRYYILGYFIFWIIYAMLFAMAFYPLISIPAHLFFLFNSIQTILFSFLGILLLNATPYIQYRKLPFVLQALNYTALGILFVGLVIVTELILFLLSGYHLAFFSIIPAQFLIGILLYGIILLYAFSRKQTVKPEEKEEEEKIISPVLEPETIIDKITVRDGTTIHLIYLPEILYLRADGDYVRIITSKGVFLKEQTMKCFEELLPHPSFVRVHRSFIVNINAITHIEKYNKQPMLILKNNDQLKMSLAGYKLLQKVLDM